MSYGSSFLASGSKYVAWNKTQCFLLEHLQISISECAFTLKSSNYKNYSY